MTYPWREQEQFYQPWRVKVVEREHYGKYWNVRAWGYAVAKFNTATHDIAYWTEDKDWGTIQDARHYSRKEDAVERAKRMAVDQHLPFIISRDQGTFKDFHKGPVLHCVICGETWGPHRQDPVRGWEPDACPDCKDAVRSYNKLHQDRRRVRIAQYGITHTPGNHYEYRVGELGYSDHAAVRAMLGIAAPAEEIVERQKVRQADIGKADAYGTSAWIVPMHEWQVESLKQAVSFMNTTVKIAFQQGLRAGSNLLAKLRDGEVHPNDFSDLRDRKGNDQ